ncbi:MAG: hypothetical protein WBV11_01600 [Salegentibacter sp.]
MEIITDFVENYKRALHGVNIVIKVLVTLALAFIIFSVISAIINVLT